MDAAEVIELEGGTLWYQPCWLPVDEANQLYCCLLDQVHWQQGRIKLFGQEHLIPRLQAWYGDPCAQYSYSGLGLQPLPWLPQLLNLKERLTAASGTPLNSVLVNLYRDGRDSNGWHADNEVELGFEPVIASVSLGATRRFRLRNIKDKSKTLAFDLPHGSLFIMGAGIQQHWQHQLSKTARKVNPRINLTYRRIIHS